VAESGRRSHSPLGPFGHHAGPRRNGLRGALLVGALGLGSLCGGPLQATAQEGLGPGLPLGAARPEVDPDRIEQLVLQLDASRFEEREEATRLLYEAGPAAIGPLERMALDGSRELTSRAIHVLGRLANDEEPLDDSPARVALERLGNRPSPFVRSRVATTLEQVDRIWQSRTIAYLQQRGAIFPTDLVIIETRASLQQGLGVVLDENWRGSIEDLARFRFIRDLYGVQVSGEAFGDEAIEVLVTAGRLRALSVRNAPLSLRAVELLSAYPRLERLELRYCPIENDAVPLLGAMNSIERLKLIGTRMTRDGVAPLIEKFGATIVDFREGGFLGVSCYTLNQQCVVSQVVEGTAAAKAGIRQQDIIVRVGDIAITSQDHLIETLARYGVGDKVKLVWSRGSETFDQELELGIFADLDPN